MFRYLQSVFSNLKPLTHSEKVNRYLSESYDTVDLERRMRELEQGKVKF